MNFFEHQQRARRQTRWLLVVFLLATLVFVALIDLVLLAAMGYFNAHAGFSWDEAMTPLLGTSALVAGVILLASLYRTMTLRSGGAAVAVELGGVRVDADTADPLRQRLRNVVEEMALASGVPVPDVYVLEREAGINAFAAGYTPADAAVAVTRGALEKLDRDQLQGVIAHEFSHILNGDMRLNIRMVGVLFGILVISVVGRQMIRLRYYGGARSRDDGRAGVVMIGFAVMVIGYAGLFMARWIKAAIARRREFLADASAVQFTRNPSGIAGALKRIAVDSRHGLLDIDAEEIDHMMIEEPKIRRLFASHPPLLERIRRIEPGFSEEDLAEVSKRMLREQHLGSVPATGVSEAVTKTAAPVPSDARQWIGSIGHPTEQQLVLAAAVTAALSPSVRTAARSVEWAPVVLLALLLDDDPVLRDEQLLRVATVLGIDGEQQLRFIWQDLRQLPAEQKLPLVELTFPALKRRPLEELRRLQTLIGELIEADRRIDVFEYAVAKMIAVMIDDLIDPPAASYGRTRRLSSVAAEALALVTVMARVGHDDPGQTARAREAAIAALGLDVVDRPEAADDWQAVLDRVLPVLDTLHIRDKETLVNALMVSISRDGKVVREEAELLRAVCAALHVPLPIG